jgi:carboxyl-terminal processing protease
MPSLQHQPNARIAGKRSSSLRALIIPTLTLAFISSVPAVALADDAAAQTSTSETAAEQLDHDQVLDLLSQLHVSGTPRSALEKQTIPGMIALLKDPYTVYFSKDDLTDFNNYLEQNYVGIGAVVGVDDAGVYIDRIIPNSPAEAAGLKADDYITAVDGEPASTTSTGDVVKTILGPAGTKVTVTVKRGGATSDYTLTRKQIQLPIVTSGSFQTGVGYIRVVDFSSEAGTEFASQLADLLKQGDKSLIIDLRDNPGGLLTSAQTIAEQFVQSGVLIHTKDRNNVDDPVQLHGQKRDLPVTILVNENSASASEVVTGALRDYGVAKVVGTKTFGKGSVQQVIDLPSGGALKVTVQEYLTPKLVKVNKVGLQPDIAVEGTMPQLVTALHTAGLASVTLKADKHHLTVNGLAVDDELPLLRQNGHVYASTRMVTSLLAGVVTWNEATRSVDVAAHGTHAVYSPTDHNLILEDGSSFVDLDAVRSSFPELSYTDANGTLSLSANVKPQ